MTQCRKTDQTKSGSQTWRSMLLITKHVQSFCLVKMLQGILINVLRLKTVCISERKQLETQPNKLFHVLRPILLLSHPRKLFQEVLPDTEGSHIKILNADISQCLSMEISAKNKAANFQLLEIKPQNFCCLHQYVFIERSLRTTEQHSSNKASLFNSVFKTV